MATKKNAKQITVTLQLPDGRRKYYRGETRKEAEAKREKDKLLLLGGVNIADDTTFGELTELWFDTCKAGKGHIRTEQTIRGILDRYVLPNLSKKLVRDIRPLDVQRLMNKVGGYSLSTQRKVLQYTRAILEFGVENGIMSKNPAIKSIKPSGAPPEEVQPLSPAQCEALLAALNGTRAYLFVLTLLLAGLRKGEALGLMWKDIDFERREIHVQRNLVYTVDNKQGILSTEMKTPAANRYVPLAPQLYDALLEAKRHSSSVYVFSMQGGGYLSESSFRRLWGLIDYRTIGTEKKRALTERTLDFDVHPHQLRHTCITNWVRSGVPVKTVQYLAGHSTLEMTMEVYTHYQHELEREETAREIANAPQLALPV